MSRPKKDPVERITDAWETLSMEDRRFVVRHLMLDLKQLERIEAERAAGHTDLPPGKPGEAPERADTG